MNEIELERSAHIITGGMPTGLTDLNDYKLDPDRVPVIPTRGLVLFPGITFPVTMVRELSVKAAEYAVDNNALVAVFCQSDPEEDNPTLPQDLINYGVLARVHKVFNHPNGKTAILESVLRVKRSDEDATEIEPSIHAIKVEVLHSPKPRIDVEFSGLIATVKDTAIDLMRDSGIDHTDLTSNLGPDNSPEQVVSLIATLSPLSIEEKDDLLRTDRLKQRAYKLLTLLSREREKALVLSSIKQRTQEQLSEQQRKIFLQQQLEAIRMELYGDDDEAEQLQTRAKDIPMPADVRKIFDRELEKLRRQNPSSPDYAVLYTYLDLLLTLPWGKTEEQLPTLAEAREILDADHYGLDKVKERIIEQIAVMLNNPEGRSPIICLVGAPGVGKTSLGQSIAKALGRKFVRVSFGGLHDEAEIRGHRRTYIGAMPGRVIDAIRRAGTSNPVMVLDEVDKMGADYKGDPGAALLEVLDPEQNCHFHDNYIDVDFDLSKVLFIATANTLSTISGPLLDRMEVIEISGYSPEEKVEIASRHLLPRLRNEHKLPEDALNVPAETLMAIVERYTSESGVRHLDKELAKLARRIIMQRLNGSGSGNEVTPDSLRDLLGNEPYMAERCADTATPGVVTGLAWTAAGGTILLMESVMLPAKNGGAITLTGNLGDVMKESAQVALQYVRSHADTLGINPDVLDNHTIHLHAPEGAIPKDGPSAGITITTAIVSAIKGQGVDPKLAMTGEMTLRGKVLPVGGIKEKLLAAKRAGVTRVMLCEANRKDVDEIAEHYKQGLEVIYVNDISDVLAVALPQG